MNMNNVYYELGDLDAEIYCIRENELKFGNPFSDEYKKIVKHYNELCDRRRILEESLDPR
jgi:hypothetical protein